NVMAPDKALFLSMFYSTNPDLSLSVLIVAYYVPVIKKPVEVPKLQISSTLGSSDRQNPGWTKAAGCAILFKISNCERMR
ncbi:MAG: hypothetical protein IIT35_03040, partial [Oscillospiraceae bacterium]|nr:hypothetical protein [Oscillospiraceae bacterium]